MFCSKRTSLAVALSMLFITKMASANNTEITEDFLTKNDFSYQIYGTIALQAAYRDYDSSNSAKDKDLGGLQFNNESRIGFRGDKQFKNFTPTFFWQIEAGFVDPSFSNAGSKFGSRDTFVGFKSDAFGKVRAGRVLTPIYELIDWPASNPGLGDVYDWGGSIGGAKYQDRQSNTLRWDTSKFFDALSFNFAAGAGDDAALGAGNSSFLGAAAHYNLGFLQFDLAYERNDNFEAEGATWTNDTYLAGVQAWFSNGLSLYMQYKLMEAVAITNTSTHFDESQSAISAGMAFTKGDWQYKVGYATNLDLERNGITLENTADNVISAQALYFVDPSAVIYARARMLDFGDKPAQIDDATKTRWKSEDFNEFSIGVEYYF